MSSYANAKMVSKCVDSCSPVENCCSDSTEETLFGQGRELIDVLSEVREKLENISHYLRSDPPRESSFDKDSPDDLFSLLMKAKKLSYDSANLCDIVGKKVGAK